MYRVPWQRVGEWRENPTVYRYVSTLFTFIYDKRAFQVFIISFNSYDIVTAYYCRFGYLWAVHSLFYWWRDQGLAEQGSIQSEHSPCYLNRMDPIEVAVGWGKYTLEVLRAFINR